MLDNMLVLYGKTTRDKKPAPLPPNTKGKNSENTKSKAESMANLTVRTKTEMHAEFYPFVQKP
jgi:hypothetical protein